MPEPGKDLTGNTRGKFCPGEEEEIKRRHADTVQYPAVAGRGYAVRGGWRREEGRALWRGRGGHGQRKIPLGAELSSHTG